MHNFLNSLISEMSDTTTTLSPQQRKNNALYANSQRKHFEELRLIELQRQLALKEPGTIRFLKSQIKDVKETMRSIQIERNCILQHIW